MPEEYIRLTGPDGHGIYGIHRKTGSRKLVIHVHGLTHHAGSYLGIMSGSFFTDNGFDHYRPSLYDHPADSRKLNTSTLTTHVRDINCIIDYFRDQYDALYISCHSLGALSMLIANPEGVKAISFWDPSLDVTNFWASGSYLTHMPEQREYKLDYGNIFVLSEEMVKEIKAYPDAKCLECARQMTTPAQFIIPALSIFLASPHTSPEAYSDAFRGVFDLCRITGANHSFSNENDRQPLFAATLRWFEQHT